MDTFGGARLVLPLLPMARCWLPMTARSPSGGLATQESELCWRILISSERAGHMILIPDYLATRSSTTPWAGTVTEYSAPFSFRSLWAQRSFTRAGADFRPRSDHLTVIFAGVLPRLNSPIACPPSKSGLAQTS